MLANWPGTFSLFGRLTDGGEPFGPNSSESDPSFRLSDDGLRWEMIYGAYAPSINPGVQPPNPLHFGFADCLVGGNLLTDWTNYMTPLSGSTAYLRPMPNTRRSSGVDTPDVVAHPQWNGRKALLFEERPGTLRSGVGDISCIGLLWGDHPQGRLCRYGTGGGREARLLLQAKQSWSLGWQLGGEWRGGKLEPTHVIRPSDEALIVFYLVIRQGTGGVEWPALGRAIFPVQNGIIGAPQEDSQPVWKPEDHGLSPTLGNHCGVYLDPDGVTCYLLVKAGQSINLYRSRSWGAAGTWTAAPGNPVLPHNISGAPTGVPGENSWGGPVLVVPPGGAEYWLVTYFRPGNQIGNPTGVTGAGIYLSKATRSVA